MKEKAIIKGSVRLINVLRTPNVTQEPQPVRQDMNALKKHINHTLCINSQLVSSDSTWPLAAFVASPGTGRSSPSPEQTGLWSLPEPKITAMHSPTRHRDELGLKALQPCGSPLPPVVWCPPCPGSRSFLGQ